MRYSRCSPAFRRNVTGAFTLIEVVVGLTLMASVLVGSLLAFAAHQKQMMAANKKIAAVAVADDLLYLFANSQDGIPTASRGPIAGQPHWYWQTTPIGTTTPLQTPMNVIRLSIAELNQDGGVDILASVDLVEALQ